MTIGQRIAQKRKELGLSQEALGDRLGVSRQSIYKWESDTALPEIDKLIALSRLFGVSVGWLLGVEEPPRDGEAAETPAPEPGELTEQQLKMVEEIVRRYSGARGLSPRRRRVLKLALAAGAVCLAGVLYSLFSQLGRLLHPQQPPHGHTEQAAEGDELVDLRQGGVGLPLVDGLAGDAQLVPQSLLREAQLFSLLGDALSDGHGDAPFLLSA